MKEKIEIGAIGTIHTPFRTVEDRVPIQGRMHRESEGTVRLFEEYRNGLKDLEGFSHIFLVYYFDRSDTVMLRARPYADKDEHGIFAIRSPHRPNHIGLTLVELVAVEDAMLRVRGVDMLDGTPLLDIKPYNPLFDSASEVRTGWMEQHDKSGSFDKKVGDQKEWLHKK